MKSREGQEHQTVDLHLHTTFSDGVYTPSEVVMKAKSSGLTTISITDHDSIGGIEEAKTSGDALNIDVIPGIELSSNFDDTEVHILGYFIDYKNKELLNSITEFQEERYNRAIRIVGKLNQMKIPIDIETVLEQVSGDSVGRPHIANALVKDGHAYSYYEAFDKYIGCGRPAYEHKWNFSPEEIIRLIAQAGGLSFIAHPGKLISENIIFRLIKAGIDGIEVFHPSHTPDLVYHYRGIVNEYCLLESGGSDFHGDHRGDEHVLGQYVVSKTIVDVMRRRLINH